MDRVGAPLGEKFEHLNETDEKGETTMSNGGVYDLGEMGLGDSQEPKVMAAGSEVQLRILDVTEDEDKNGHAYALPRFEVVDEPLAKDFTHFVYIPNKEWMDAKRLNRSQWDMRVFLEAFSVDTASRISFRDQLPGLTGWAILGVRDSDEYGRQNYIKKFIQKR